MHQLGSSLHMIFRYVVSNNRSTSCDCIVNNLLTNRKIELRTNVVDALWRIGDDPNDVPFIAGVDTRRLLTAIAVKNLLSQLGDARVSLIFQRVAMYVKRNIE
uniref:Uncharacterized protein n=1 Tax=Caenorhabditis japonica TaxID=281687 RepID=A0A8R1EBR3_CAEJA